jgi:hypothetical protein
VVIIKACRLDYIACPEIISVNASHRLRIDKSDAEDVKLNTNCQGKQNILKTVKTILCCNFTWESRADCKKVKCGPKLLEG